MRLDPRAEPDRRLAGRYRVLLGCGLMLLAMTMLLGLSHWLGYSISIGGLTDWDRSVHAWVVARRDDWPRVTLFLRGVTWLGDPAFATLATIVVSVVLGALHRRSIGAVRRSDPQVWLGAILVSWMFGRALKLLFKRERPPLVNRLVVESAYSFPSGHSVFAGAFSTLLAILLSRGIPPNRVGLRRVAVTLSFSAAVLIGLSRIWLGVHFPTDVLAGLAIGSALSGGVWLVFTGWNEATSRGARSVPSAESSQVPEGRSSGG